MLTSWMSLLLLSLSSSACETQKVPEAIPAMTGVTETNAEMPGLGKAGKARAGVAITAPEQEQQILCHAGIQVSLSRLQSTNQVSALQNWSRGSTWCCCWRLSAAAGCSWLF